MRREPRKKTHPFPTSLHNPAFNLAFFCLFAINPFLFPCSNHHRTFRIVLQHPRTHSLYSPARTFLPEYQRRGLLAAALHVCRTKTRYHLFPARRRAVDPAPFIRKGIVRAKVWRDYQLTMQHISWLRPRGQRRQHAVPRCCQPSNRCLRRQVACHEP